MIDPDSLNVWFNQSLVGYLWRNNVGYLAFRYSSEWLQSDGFAISQSLPLSKNPFLAEHGIANNFFANLLPEGNVRQHIARDLKISNTDFNLLRAIGGECAGALSILNVEQTPDKNQRYQQLSKNEFKKLVLRRGQIYASASSYKTPRLSLAGAQDKCPILFKNNTYFLPESEAPSSHLLKFESPDYRHLPAYEVFTTLLAKNINLPVVNIQLQTIDQNTFAQTERYDRIWNAGEKLERLHQEDFCQALAYGHDKKYQESGGPSFADCFTLLQNVSSDPIIDTQNLLRWQIFNVLAGNSDGHAKNISLVYSKNNRIRLAPFYDLICTRAIERIDDKLAFDVAGQRDPGKITLSDWHALATQCDVGARYIQKLVHESATQLLAQIDSTINQFESVYGAFAALQRIKHIVVKQCNNALDGKH